MLSGKGLVRKIQKNLFIGLLAFLLITLLLLYTSFLWFANQEMKRALKEFSENFKEFLETQGNVHLGKVLIISESRRIREIYLSLKKEVGDLSYLSEDNKMIFERYGRVLRNEVEPLLQKIEKETGYRPALHFHLPGPRSFVRTWRKVGEDVKLDDLSKFRVSVAKAQKERRIIKGLEAGRDGLFYRVIVPLVSEDEVLGSVESAIDLKELLARKFVTGKNQANSYLVLLKPELGKIMEGYIREGKAKVLNDTIVYGHSENLESKFIQKIISKATHETVTRTANLLWGYLPLVDFSGNEIGYLYLGYDTSYLVHFLKVIFLVMISVFLVLGMVFLFILNRSVSHSTRSLINTAKAMEELAKGEGDLTFRLQANTEDEIGVLAKHFNHFMETLATIVKTLMERTKVLFKEAETLERSVFSLEQTSSEVLSSMENISQALQEFSKAIQEITIRTQECILVIRNFIKAAEKTSSVTVTLKKASSEIDEISSFINNVAERIKILALNAAIEAARAGVAGKGFTVVANEVKELAKQTKEATRSITERINLLKTSSEDVFNGVRELTELVKVIEPTAEAIAAAVEEQSIVINNIYQILLKVKDKIGQTDKDKSENITLIDTAEGLKITTSELRKVATEIHNIVSRFNV